VECQAGIVLVRLLGRHAACDDLAEDTGHDVSLHLRRHTYTGCRQGRRD
jgi:hypothetical protein